MEQDQTTTKPTAAETLRALAAEIRQNPTARDAVAQGFELIAEQLEPCEDCAAKTQAAADEVAA